MRQRLAVALATLLVFSGATFGVAAQEDPEEGAEVQTDGDEEANAEGAEADLPADEGDAEAFDEPAGEEADFGDEEADPGVADTEQDVGDEEPAAEEPATEDEPLPEE